MAVNGIFAVRPDSNRVENDLVGTLRSGEVVRRKPVALEHFIVSTDDDDVAESIEQMLGGDAFERDSDKESIGVRTPASSVDVVFESIDSGFVVFAGTQFVRSCNGSVITGGEGAGEACPCAELDLEGRKAFAAKGGCRPNVRIIFRFADAEALGRFQYRSGSWGLLDQIQRVERAVDEAGDAEKPNLHGTIAIEKVVTKAGRALTLPKVSVKR